ncbi:MAG: tRNA lysidine(34) synthetase TilS [Selenomonadaceae bacterium]|nr:tRNA lysidine(34) synthetase TilS [Selenomonadaceae bacterium]
MLKKFIDLCQNEKIFYGRKIVVAVSGGADSLALADLLNRSRQKFKNEICIAHYEHGLRGEESLADAEFVEEFAKNLGVEFFCEHGDVKKFSAENKISVETAARILRYEFLNKVRLKKIFDTIALAHHADDQAETVLMKFLRGASSAGLSAMKFFAVTEDYGLLIRPLLKFKKVELEEYCRKRNFSPRIDKTNFQTDATRNKIRLELLPTLKNFNPAIVETLCRFAEISAEETEFINSEVEKIFPAVVENHELLQKEFLKLQPALQRAVIKKFVELETGSIKDFGFVHFEGVRKVLTENLSGVELPKKFRAVLKRGKLSITKNFFL